MPTQTQRHATQSSASLSTGASRSAAQPGQSNQALQEQMRQVTALTRSIADTQFEDTGLRAGVLAKALGAFELAFMEGRSTSPVVTIIDYELPSSERRLWVIDLAQAQLLFHEFTTHGQGSDRNHDGKMDSASNRSGSHQSNVGLLVTDETYTGRHGKSLKMRGMEPGFNDNAYDRSIVVHSASYADDEYIARHGKAGRSHGCPALDPDVSGRIIDTIKNGKLLFAYYPDPDWVSRSRYLNP